MIAPDNRTFQDCPKTFYSVSVQAFSGGKFAQTVTYRNVREFLWIRLFVVHNVVALEVVCHYNGVRFRYCRDYG